MNQFIRIVYWTNWPCIWLPLGDLVQRDDATRHDRTPHNGDSRCSTYAHYPESASPGLWQLFVCGRESAGQDEKNAAVDGQTEYRDGSFECCESVQGSVSSNSIFLNKNKLKTVPNNPATTCPGWFTLMHRLKRPSCRTASPCPVRRAATNRIWSRTASIITRISMRSPIAAAATAAARRSSIGRSCRTTGEMLCYPV